MGPETRLETRLQHRFTQEMGLKTKLQHRSKIHLGDVAGDKLAPV